MKQKLLGLVCLFLAVTILVKINQPNPASRPQPTGISATPSPTAAATDLLEFEPYQELIFTDQTADTKVAQITDKKGTTYRLRNVPLYNSLRVGPDGKTVHAMKPPQYDEESTELFKSQVCFSLPKSAAADIDYQKIDSELCSGYLWNGLMVSYVTGETVEGQAIEVKPAEVTAFRISLSDQVGSANGVGKLSYTYPTRYVVDKNRPQLLFLLFEQDLVVVDTDKKTAEYVATLAERYPENYSLSVQGHPQLPVWVLSSGWESDPLSRYLIDGSVSPARAIPLPKELAAAATSKSRWDDTWQLGVDDITVVNSFNWTEQGLTLTTFTEKELLYDQAKIKQLHEAVQKLELEELITANNKIDQDLELELKRKYDVHNVICSTDQEGPGSGFGCVGLIGRAEYTFVAGELQLRKTSEQRWSGQQRF